MTTPDERRRRRSVDNHGGVMLSVRTLVMRRLASHVRGGTLVVEERGGTWTAGTGSPMIRLTVHDRRAYGALLRRGSIGLAESYVAGWWDCDNLTGLVRLLIESLARPLRWMDRIGQKMSGPISLWHRRKGPSKEVDRANVRAHYDLPVGLYAVMLDETMAYSCGVFDSPATSLGDAQIAKFDRICRKLELGPDDHLVEIGTGWGGFAIHAASNYGCRVTTTTVSQSQFEVASQRVVQADLEGRVKVLDVDYRDLSGQYDKLVSIEMIEAVGWRQFDTFFATCERLLRPEGIMALQAIVIADQSYERAKHHDDFIRQFIFPGGCLPSINVVSSSLTRATDLRIFDLEDIGRHYATTLQRWHDNLESQWEGMTASGLDEEFHRMWRLYLCYCKAAFLERRTSAVQMMIAGPQYKPALGLRLE
jgi:cyclopropane-fatty-acyl-phospholipid synthase